MSFSSDIKKELGKINNLSNKVQVLYELIGYLITYNTKIINKKTLRFATESDYNINRFSKLLENLKIEHNIEMEGNLFVISFKLKDISQDFLEKSTLTLNDKFDKLELNEEEIKSLIRGCFLGSGSINNPETNYHLEITFSQIINMKKIQNLIEQKGIKVKTLEKENKYSIYIKEAEEISRLLALMGASKGVLKFEEIRIQREMRGKVNRIVNCETANLNKTINAAVQQIEAIKKLKDQGKFGKLNDNLKEIANLRLKNPDISYEELGNMLKNPIGKSGVNYRLKKIIEIAQEGEEK